LFCVTLYEDSRSIGVNRLRATIVYNVQLVAASLPPLLENNVESLDGARTLACHCSITTVDFMRTLVYDSMHGTRVPGWYVRRCATGFLSPSTREMLRYFVLSPRLEVVTGAPRGINWHLMIRYMVEDITRKIKYLFWYIDEYENG